MDTAQTFVINCLTKTKLDDSTILDSLSYDIEHIEYDDLADYLSSICIIYNNFLFTQILPSELIYFTNYDNFNQQIQKIKDQAKQGDLISFNNIPIIKYININNKLISLTYHNESKFYFLPIEALYVIRKYNIQTIDDIKKLYSKNNIFGIIIGFTLPSAEKVIKACYFATPDDNDFIIQFKNGQLLCLKFVK